ncbi:MAG: hypothetical protein AAGL10_05760, partial [Pseudomonadota bacterium]
MPSAVTKTRSRLIGSVAGLAAFAAFSTKAQAQEAGLPQRADLGLRNILEIDGVVSAELQDDGSVRVTFEDGTVKTLAAGEVIVENGMIFIDVGAGSVMGLGGEASPAIIALGVAAVGGLIAVAASGGDDVVPPPVNTAPTFSSASTASLSENGTDTGLSVSAADAEGDSVSFSISGGADADLFEIDASTGALSFIEAPDFEAPGDADGNNVFDIEVSASDGQLTATQTLAVTVTNQVDFSGTPEADTLTGTDGDDEIEALAGNDLIDSLAGSDDITTGEGNDVLVYAGDPFEGADVSAAGRQVVGGEDFIRDFSFGTAVTSIVVNSGATS